MLVRVWRPPWPVNVDLVLAPHRRGRGDPSHQVTPDGAHWRTCRTPDGPGTLRLRTWTAGGRVDARAWGPGAGWLLDGLPALLGAGDDPGSFVPCHAVLRRTAARLPGLRVGRTSRVLEALVPGVLEQKVTGTEARRAWRTLLRWHGDRAPGPAPERMRVAPAARTWTAIPTWDWHRAGVDGRRARTVISAARAAGRLEETLAMPPDDAARRLRALPGVGEWTTAEVMQRAHGDTDAVSVGDCHLPGLVGMALAGHPVDDEGMLRLLAPYAGHRHRAARLVELSGVRTPRRGPRMAPRDYRAI